MQCQARGRVDADPLALQQSAIGQQAQYPGKDLLVRVQIDQPPRTRNRRVVRRALLQRNPHKAPQCQRVRQPIRKSKVFENAQGVFVRIAAWRWGHASSGRSRKGCGSHTRSWPRRRASVLPEAERAAGSGALRPVCREPLREVLCGPVRSAVSDAGDLLSVAADRVFRRHRGRARHCLSCPTSSSVGNTRT